MHTRRTTPAATPPPGGCRSGSRSASPPRCARIGLAWLPGADLDRAFMVMGYVFCVSSAFALAKFVRDNEVRSRRLADVEGRWCGAPSSLAMALTGWGL